MKYSLPLLALAIVDAAPAQTVVPFQGDSHWTSWPTYLSDPGVFGRAVAGQFTPDGALDVALIDGAELVLLSNPDEFFAPSKVATGVADVERLTGAGMAGLDALATVGSSGLRRCWYDAPSASFLSAAIGSPSWTGARLVRSADVNGDGLADLLGLAADGQTVLQLIATSPTSFSAGTSSAALATVRNLLALQWDTDSPLEVALLTDLSVEVRDLDGTLLDDFTAATPGGAFCAIGQAGTAQERLVWITEYAPPAFQYLIALSPGGVADIVDLGALDAFAVVPTDYDLDGDDDILISHKFSYELLWIQNQRTPQSPSGPSFTPVGDRKVFEVANPGPAPQNEAWPVAADLDGDGDDDVAFAIQGDLRFNVYRGEAISQDARRASIVSGVYVPGLLGGNGTLNLVLGAPSTFPAGATHVEVRAWRRASLGVPLDPAPVAVKSFALPAFWPIAASLTLPETSTSFADNYEVHVRLVKRNAAGAVTKCFPSSVGTFGLLLADRNALALDPAAFPAIDVLILQFLEPVQLPFFVCARRLKVPPSSPSGGCWSNVPNFG
jgi:hypothetical protein